MKNKVLKGIKQDEWLVKQLPATDTSKPEPEPNHPPHYDDEPDVTGKRLFPLGKIVITRGAMLALTPETVNKAVTRHISGSWGNLCEQDKLANSFAIKHGERVISKYRGEGDEDFYIITEWDRSYTTILLTNEY